MTALKTLIGWLALLFHLLFCLVLAGLGAFALASGPQFFRLAMLSWTGSTLACILLAGGLFGLLSVILAAMGKARFLFLLWAMLAAVVLTRSLVFSNYHFGPGDWRRAVYLVSAAWFAVIGAAFILGAKPAPGPRKYRVR